MSKCTHPTDKCYWEGGEDDDGEWEQYYCRNCNRYLIIPEVEEIRNRPEWVTWQVENN